jgi:hypothetical protein
MVRRVWVVPFWYIFLLADDSGAWVSLFDGRSTSGWLEVTGRPFPAESWTIEDGCLKALPARDTTAQDIRTAGTYRNFELEWEWKVGALGNSGVKYLLGRTDEWVPPGKTGRNARARGFEYQLADDANPDAASPLRSCSSLYSAIAPYPKLPCEPEVFHKSGIVVRPGGRVEHWLEGGRVCAGPGGGAESRRDEPGAIGPGRILRRQESDRAAESWNYGVVPEYSDPRATVVSVRLLIATLSYTGG